MIKNFTFAPFPKIVFGAGSISELTKHSIKYGNTVLLITGGESLKKSGKLSKIQSKLQNENLKIYTESINSEPSPSDIDAITEIYHEKNIKLVISIGGGSVLDAGKAISAMLLKKGPVKDYLEGVGSKSPDGEKIPFIAIPTTSGTGSETTKNAVISEIGNTGFKKSLRHDNYIPNIALVDPELTLDCPPEITAASGMDAFSQLLESFTSTKCDEISASLAYNAMKAIKRSLVNVYKDGSNIEARADLSYAAMISGITLANAGLGIIHGFASPLGGYFKIPHGVVCGSLMAVCNKYTVNKLLDNNDVQSLEKYREVAKLFDGNSSSDKININSFIDYLYELTEILNIQRLGNYGITESDFKKIIDSTENKNNPVELTKDEMYNILKERI